MLIAFWLLMSDGHADFTERIIHHDYGLVWHNGKAIFLSQLQFPQDQKIPKASSPPLTLGQFDNVTSVCWSKAKSYGTDDNHTHLCVQHDDHISIWVVSGRYPNIQCDKQTEQRVKALPQGCLWHPTTSVLCVLSNREFHIYNAHTTKWDTVSCNGKLSAGCWVKDGSKFILAMGSEVTVYIFNTETLSLEPTGSGNNNTASIHGLNTHMSIKTMVPVAKDMVAIATDLPLDSLICQSRQNLCKAPSMKDTHLEPVIAVEPTPTSEFSLIIPRDCIVQNPVAEMFKDVEPKVTTTREESESTKPISKPPSPSAEEKRTPSADTLGSKLDQILSLMKRMDVMPDARESHLQQRKQHSTLRSKVESTMCDSSTSGPIDITAMITGTTPLDSPSRRKMQTVAGSNGTSSSPRQNADGSKTSGHKEEAVLDIKSDDISSSSRQSDTASKQPVQEDKAAASNTDTVTELIAKEIQGRQSGPVDVTALLAAKSTDRTKDQLNTGNSHGNGALDVSRKDDGDNTRTNESTDDNQESEDIIDLTDLKANMIQSNVSPVSHYKQKADITDTAKLSVLHVSALEDPVTVTSVDLPGILTPDLLYYQEGAQSFVVGTNTQKQLLVYTLKANTLEPAKEKITLPDSHRPLGMCSIPECPTGLLVLAGKSLSSTSDGAFLSFSSEVQMDLKLFSYQLKLQKDDSFTDTSKVTDTTDTSSVYQPSSQDALRFSPLDFQLKDTPTIPAHPTPIKYEFHIESDNEQDSQYQQMLVSFPAKETGSSLELTNTNEQTDGTLPHSPVPSTSHAEMTPSQTVSPTIFSQSTHEQTLPRTSHTAETSVSSRPWASTPRFRATTQRPWMSSFSQRPGQRTGRVWQIPGPESNSSSGTSNVTTKYPYPEDADLLHLICEGLEEAPVLRTFLLNQQLLKLQVVKDAFGLDSVEMKIRDNWVVLTDDTDGFIPIRFSPNTSHTIKAVSRASSNNT